SPFRITEWFQAPHGAARRNEDQSAARPSGHRPHARRSRATRRPVDAVGTERGVHWVWLRRRRSLGGLPWLAPEGRVSQYIRNRRRARCYCVRQDPEEPEAE